MPALHPNQLVVGQMYRRRSKANPGLKLIAQRFNGINQQTGRPRFGLGGDPLPDPAIWDFYAAGNANINVQPQQPGNPPPANPPPPPPPAPGAGAGAGAGGAGAGGPVMMELEGGRRKKRRGTRKHRKSKGRKSHKGRKH